MTKGDKSYNTVSAGCLRAYIPNISSEGWLEKTSQGHHLTLGWVRISLAKWDSEGAMGLVCPTGWVITLKLQRVLPWTMSVPQDRDCSKHLMCVNSFNLHRSKYRRRKGGTAGAWGRGLLRAELQKKTGPAVEGFVNRAAR